MASLFSMSKNQLLNLLNEQKRAIEDHRKRSSYSSDLQKHEYTLKRLERRLQEIEEALQRF